MRKMIFVLVLSVNVSYALKFDDEKFYHTFNPNHPDESRRCQARNKERKKKAKTKMTMTTKTKTTTTTTTTKTTTTSTTCGFLVEIVYKLESKSFAV